MTSLRLKVHSALLSRGWALDIRFRSSEGRCTARNSLSSTNYRRCLQDELAYSVCLKTLDSLKIEKFRLFLHYRIPSSSDHHPLQGARRQGAQCRSAITS